MDRSEIAQLAAALEEALILEHKTKIASESAVACAERVKTLELDTARADGLIDGKNADTRKRQVEAVLAESEPYAAELENVARAQNDAAMAGIARRSQEAVIGLTKAWLYSQSGRISIGLGR